MGIEEARGEAISLNDLNDRVLEILIEAGTLATGQIRYGWVCVDSIFTMSQPSVSRAIRPNPAVARICRGQRCYDARAAWPW
jgi:hypothetical protein